MIFLLNVRFHGVMAMHRMQGLVASMHANRLGGDSHASLLAHSSTERMPPSVMVCARRQIGETVPGDSHANRLGRQARGGGVAAAWWQHPDLLNVADLSPYPSILAMHRQCTGYAQRSLANSTGAGSAASIVPHPLRSEPDRWEFQTMIF